MVDVENLEKYIVIQAGSVALDSVSDLREFEGDFGHGIYALFSDEQETIVAFAFEPTVWSEEEAQAWVKGAQQKNFSGLEVLASFFGSAFKHLLGRTESPRPKASPVALRSFDDIRRLVDQKLEDLYATRDPETSDVDYPWVIDIGTNAFVFEFQGVRYTAPYSINDDDVVTIGEAEKVDKSWVRDDDGSPVVLHRFDVHLGSGEEAEPDEDDGLIWKEIIHPGKWFKTNTGRVVEISKEIIEEAFRAWEAGFPKYVSVPADSHHEESGGDVPPQSNRGFVKRLKLIGDRLFGGFQFTDPEVAYGVQVGNIADCSVSLMPDLVHPETGEKFGWVLQHVLLTNFPLVQDLAPFGVSALSADGKGQVVVVSYQPCEEVGNMPKQNQTNVPDTPAPDAVQLSGEDRATLDALKGLNLSADDIQAMAAQRQAVQQKARDLEITKVVRALEGKEKHEGVVQIEGYRHAPVVCAAVEKALKEQPAALSLSASDEGTTTLDAVVLEIVNAIPEEGRIKLSANDDQPAPNRLPENNDPTLSPADAEATDDQIDELYGRIV